MPATSAASVPAIVQWFSLYGNIIFFFAELLWWIATGVAAVWAAWTFSKLVKLRAAKAAAAMAASDTDADADTDPDAGAGTDAAADKDVDVDKFVD